jgi:hypothetical protein
MAHMTLVPGGLCEPHWHANADEPHVTQHLGISPDTLAAIPKDNLGLLPA